MEILIASLFEVAKITGDNLSITGESVKKKIHAFSDDEITHAHTHIHTQVHELDIYVSTWINLKSRRLCEKSKL